MISTKMTHSTAITRLFLAALLALSLTVAAHASAPGITSTNTTPATFNLDATDAYLNQPDGATVYSWGYGCNETVPAASFQPAAMQTVATCPNMQIPGPTMIVTENTTITITLTNNLPVPAGNTSILFPGLNVTAAVAAATQPAGCTNTGAPVSQGLLAMEVAPGCAITYTITGPTPGTHAYYSGTQSDLQIEMGLYGAIIVLPATTPTACTTGTINDNRAVESFWGESDFRNAGSTGGIIGAAYDNPKTCYNREYLFQWGEMDANIHRAALAQVTAALNSGACTTPSNAACSLHVPTEPYHPGYFLINGRSMPDLMDPNYAAEYPHQPYNGNPHLHPGELMLIRTIGQGRWQHPYHEHANHVRILARDGNLILSANNNTSGNDLAGILMFDTDTTPGDAFDGIFYFTGRGLNWDPYGHTPKDFANDQLATLPCTADANGYNTGYAASDTGFASTPDPNVLHAVNYYEWCQDHNKPVEANPLGDVASGGPATLPTPNIFTNGPWYGGTPYLGPDATLRSGSALRPVSGDATTASGQYGGTGGCTTGQTIVTPGAANPTPGCAPLQPANTQANPANERGWAYMWHSHNEREITTNNVFPGGMLMMLLVDSREFVIDETN